MSQHKKESAFLKSLIVYEDSEECRQFHERLAKAERENKCIKRALLLVGLIAMLCGAGLGYSSVLLDDFFRDKMHPLTQFFVGLGTTSMIAFIFFLGNYLWHVSQIRRLHQECRAHVLSVVQSRLGQHAAPFENSTMAQEHSKVIEIPTASTSAESKLLPLPKVS